MSRAIARGSDESHCTDLEGEAPGRDGLELRALALEEVEGYLVGANDGGHTGPRDVTPVCEHASLGAHAHSHDTLYLLTCIGEGTETENASSVWFSNAWKHLGSHQDHHICFSYTRQTVAIQDREAITMCCAVTPGGFAHPASGDSRG